MEPSNLLNLLRTSRNPLLNLLTRSTCSGKVLQAALTSEGWYSPWALHGLHCMLWAQHAQSMLARIPTLSRLA